jgi:hypothetical protein
MTSTIRPLRRRSAARAQWSFHGGAGVEIALRLRIVMCPRTCIVDLLQYKEMKECSGHLACFLVKDRHPRLFWLPEAPYMSRNDRPWAK